MTTTDRLAKAARTLASPLAAESDQAWASAAESAMIEVLGCDRGVLHWPEAGLMMSDSITPSELARYETYLPVLHRIGYFERTVRLGVARRRDAYGPHYGAMQATEYVQEFLPWVRGFDALTLTVDGTRPRRQDEVGGRVQLLSHMATPDRAFGSDHMDLARQVFPAFAAGVAVYRQAGRMRANVAALVDASGSACALYSMAAHLVHVSKDLEAILAREPGRTDLMDAVDTLARRVVRTGGAGASHVSGTRGLYSLAASQIVGPRPLLIVAVQPPSERFSWPSRSTLSDRFGLTPRQAEVALLLATRRSNKEIAAALSVSVHTARHHVEAVLGALQVPRSEVGRALADLHQIS